MKIFISYSRKDQKFVKQLSNELSKTGAEVWWDTYISGGEQFSRMIQDAIDRSDFVIVVMSPASVESQWVEREYIYALGKNSKVIPVMHKNCPVPLALINRDYVDFDNLSFKDAFAELLVSLKITPTVPVEQKPNGIWQKVSEYRTAIIAGAVVLLLAVITAVVMSSFSRGQATLEPTETLQTGVTAEPIKESTATDTPIATDTPEPSPTVTPTVFAGTETATPFPASITDEKGAAMQLIAAGEFMMGTAKGKDDEKPAHTVMLSSYYIDTYETTNKLYRQCVQAGACTEPANLSSFSRVDYFKNTKYDNYPVVFVTWEQSNLFCKWRGARLPTEAEWEKAARGKLEQKLYPWGDQPPVCVKGTKNGANFDDGSACGDTDTTPVGSYEANGYGVFDMTGNVWEWVADWYSATYYNDLGEKAIDPQGPDVAFRNQKVLRGGGWGSGKLDSLSVINRGFSDFLVFGDDLGFRCAKTP